MDKQTQNHVLVVEDDKFLSGIYEKKLQIEGYQVGVADNGADGLAQAKRLPPQVILLDILLPKLDGLSVLQELKLNEATKNIPVILLTNLGQKDEMDKGLKLGAADYLIKAHFKPSEVVQRIKKYFVQPT